MLELPLSSAGHCLPVTRQNMVASEALPTSNLASCSSARRKPFIQVFCSTLYLDWVLFFVNSAACTKPSAAFSVWPAKQQTALLLELLCCNCCRHVPVAGGTHGSK